MALSKYDDFIAPNLDRGDFSYATTGGVEYPAADQVNIFGPLYLPRVYGKDLTAFEIASSGSVAVTLNDIHSFDLVRDNANSNIVLQTYANDSFYINVANSNMYLGMDTTSNTATLFSSNDIIVQAVDKLTLQGNTVDLVIGESFGLNAKNISLTAESNVAVTGTLGEIRFAASNSNITFAMAENNAILYASNNILVAASNDYFVSAQSNVSISAVSNNLVLTAHDNAMSITMDAATDVMTITAAGSMVMNSSSNVDISAQNSVNLSAAGGLAGLTIDSASSNINMFTTKTISIDAQSNVDISAQNSINLSAAGGLAGMTIDSGTSNIDIFTTKNITIDAQSALTMKSVNECILDAGQTITVTGGDTISMFSSNNFQVTASNTISMEAQASSLNLSANGGQVFASFDAPTNSLYVGTSSNISMTASNNTVIASSLDTSVSAASNLTLSGLSNVFMKRNDNNLISVNDGDFITMIAGGSPIIKAYQDRVTINGNVEVSGVINTIDITRSNLQISDLFVTLGVDSNIGALPDGPNTNSGAGLYIAGQDGAGDSNARSLTWNYGAAGINALGSDAGLDTESYWDLRGGALRITHSNASKHVSFALRIGANDELELVKKVGNGTFKRVARFGRTLL